MNLKEFQYNSSKWWEINNGKVDKLTVKRFEKYAEDYGNGLELRNGSDEFIEGGEPWNGDTVVREVTA